MIIQSASLILGVKQLQAQSHAEEGSPSKVAKGPEVTKASPLELLDAEQRDARYRDTSDALLEFTQKMEEFEKSAQQDRDEYEYDDIEPGSVSDGHHDSPKYSLPAHISSIKQAVKKRDLDKVSAEVNAMSDMIQRREKLKHSPK